MRMISAVCAVVLVSVGCSGCLRKEVSHIIYLAPSGVIWTALETGVRSDSAAPADRIREEHDYFLAASAGQHPMAQALRRLGGQSVTTAWLRRERPYSVITEARFIDLRQLATAVLREAQARGEVTLVREGCQARFGLRVDLESAPESDDGLLDELLTDLDRYRFILAEGHFVSADGFEIMDEGTIAAPDAKKTAQDGILTLALAWADEGCVIKN